MRWALLALASLTLSAASDPIAGPISLTMGRPGQSYTLRIAPDGTLTIESSDTQGTTRQVKAAGLADYRRIKALVDPAHRWAGGEVPCDPAQPNALFPGPFWTAPPAVVRWEAERREVRVPLTCMHGPADNEIEYVRAAFDSLREWASTYQEPGDPLANVVEEDTRVGGKQ